MPVECHPLTTQSPAHTAIMRQSATPTRFERLYADRQTCMAVCALRRRVTKAGGLPSSIPTTPGPGTAEIP